MRWGQLGRVAAALALLGFGLYGAFLAGRVQSPPSAVPASRDEFAELRNQIGDFSKDGRAGTRCGPDETELCHVPFVRLIASPEKFHGRRIIVTGLLASGPNGATLYPSEASARFDLGDGIRLQDMQVRTHGWPPFIPEEFWPRMEKGVWVSLVGTFDATDFTQIQTMGMLRDVEYVEDLPDFQHKEGPVIPPPPILKNIPPQPAIAPRFH